MTSICFDLGGTLINDPFPDCFRKLRGKCLAGEFQIPMPGQFIGDYFERWQELNWTNNFPFASHFLQEEIWLIRASIECARAHGFTLSTEMVLTAPLLLREYRLLAKDHIAHQPQLPTLRKTMQWVVEQGFNVSVASNDREIATSTMIEWADLGEYVATILTSESLSRKYAGAEKPSQQFFLAVMKELGLPAHRIVYIGDSESNDITPAMKLGIVAVRYINTENPKDATWLDNSRETKAKFKYSEPGKLRGILESILFSGNEY